MDSIHIHYSDDPLALAHCTCTKGACTNGYTVPISLEKQEAACGEKGLWY